MEEKIEAGTKEAAGLQAAALNRFAAPSQEG